MKITSENTIAETAKNYSEAGKSWHFHILAPDCQLNDANKFALLLESANGSETLVSYSDVKPSQSGKELVELLHGKNITKQEGSESDKTEPTDKVIPLLEKIKVFQETETRWHHHMLFPDCMFNPNPGSWVILLEDPSTQEKLSAIYADEPRGDLRFIEIEFYKP